MTTTTATTNDRPSEFDARITAYIPGMINLAKKLGFRGDDAKELVQDTVVYALSHWQNYREDGCMWNWLRWSMRGIVSNKNIKRRIHIVHGMGADLAMARASVPPQQEGYAELSAVLGRLTGRAGGVLVRRAMGDGLAEIANDMGVCMERVRQLETAGRKAVRVGRCA